MKDKYLNLNKNNEYFNSTIESIRRAWLFIRALCIINLIGAIYNCYYIPTDPDCITGFVVCLGACIGLYYIGYAYCRYMICQLLLQIKSIEVLEKLSKSN